MSIFESELFGVNNLTASINQQETVPGRIGELGIFEESGMTSTVAKIEHKQGKLKLVSNQPRGSVGQSLGSENRSIIAVNATHLPQIDSVMADEVNGVRAFGTENQFEAVQTVIDGKTARMRRNIDATIEYHRVGALQGKVLDADGATVIHDLYQIFGIKKATGKINFGSDNVKNKSREWRRVSQNNLGMTTVPSYRALCGTEFFDEMTAADETSRAWERYNDGEMLRNDIKDAFLFGGIYWEEYAAMLGGNYLIPKDKAILIPEGVAELFITRFAPADYMDAVNTIGLPYYASSESMKHNKGVELESQSNPVNLCTIPNAIIELSLA